MAGLRPIVDNHEHMQVDELTRAFEYHYWATHRLLGVVTTLTSEEFVRDVAGSYGSVRNTLVHILSAEWGWLDRCGGRARPERLNPADFPEPSRLVEQWAQVEGYVREFLARLTAADVTRVVEFSFGGPTHRLAVGSLLQHSFVHAIHHRGQVSLLLRLLGRTPKDFDLLYYEASLATATHNAG